MEQRSAATVVDLPAISNTFPAPPDNEIVRDSLVQALNDIFAGDTRVVVLEGAEGTGKTTLASQYVRAVAQRTPSVFIRSASPWAFEPSSLRQDLAAQLTWLLDQDSLSPDKRVTEADLSLLHMRCLKAAKKERVVYVLDGLEHVPQSNKLLLRQILELLPIGADEFRFVVSGNVTELVAGSIRDVPIKPFQVPSFGLDETFRFMSPMDLDRRDVDRFHRVFRGNPAQLAAVSRLVESGADVDALLDGGDDAMRGLLAREWEALVSGKTLHEAILASMAFLRQQPTIESLAALTRSDIQQVQAAVGELPFVRVGVAIDKLECVEFEAEVFRQFAADQLEDRREDVVDQFIEYLTGESDSQEALRHLPHILHEREDYTGVLAYLSRPETLRATRSAASTLHVHEVLRVGVESAEKLERIPELAGLSLQLSALRDIVHGGARRAEIEALSMAGEWDVALARALAVPLQESRLQLLAALARSHLREGNDPPEEVQQEIESLYTDIDAGQLGELGLEVAADLIHLRPDLAAELIERCSSSPLDDPAKFASAAVSLGTAASDEGSVRLEDVLRNIQDLGFRRAVEGVSLLFGSRSGDRVVEKLGEVANASRRVFLVRQWLGMNGESEDALKVVRFALDDIVSSSEYSPNATVFRDLVAPLRHHVGHPLLPDLLHDLRGQLSNVRHLGPTQDAISYQASMCEVAIEVGDSDAVSDVLDLYYLIADQEALDIRTAGLATLLSLLARADAERRLEEEEGLHSLVAEELHRGFEELINDTAEQYDTVKGCLRQLAATNPTRATEYALSLNTRKRRSRALIDVLKVALESGRALPVWIEEVLSSLEIPYLRSEAVYSVLNAALAGQLTLAVPERGRIEDFVREHLEPKERCRCLGMLIQVACGDGGPDAEVANLTKLLEESIAEIDTAWDRVDVVYEMSAQIRPVDADLSDALLATAEYENKANALSNGGSIWAYLDVLTLAVRTLGSLFGQDAYDDSAFDEMARIVDRVPSPGHQAVLWSELALRAASADKGDLCRRIVQDRVEPTLRSRFGDGPLPIGLLLAVAPALYVSHPASMIEALRLYPIVVRDDALHAVFEYLRTGIPPSEPHSDPEKADRELSHRKVFELCNLADEITRDYSICEIVRSVGRAVSKGTAGEQLTRQQRGMIATRLSRLCDEKLPDEENICHAGYLVACSAAIASIERAGKSRWDEIKEAARAIPNAADRVLVLAWVAEFIPQGRGKRAVLQEASELVQSLPSAIDRIERWYAIAQAAAEEDRSLARGCITNLMGLGAAQGDQSLRETQRRAIDLAHRIDPEFASELASAVDDDPAKRRILSQPDASRVQLQAHLSTRLAQLRSKDSLMDGSAPDFRDDSWWRGAELALGALNAGRVRTLDVPATVAVLSGVSSRPLSRASAAFAFTVESAGRRFHDSPEALNTLEPMFRSFVLAADFVAVFSEALSARSIADEATDIAADYRADVQLSGLLIREGQRGEALAFLEKWIWGRSDEQVVIVDPFFHPDCMDVIGALSEDGRDRTFTVLRGPFEMDEGYGELIQAYRRAWNLLSDNPMPIIEVIGVGSEEDRRPPFHDRWILMESAGLSIGTSLNGLGARLSEIQELRPKKVRELRAEMGDFLNRRQHFHKGERLHYRMFTP